MIKIKAKKLSQEAFMKYGTYQDFLDDQSLAQKSIFPHTFFADIVTLDFGTSTFPTASVCNPKKQNKMIVNFLEAHQFTCEGLLPLDDDVVIFVGTPGIPGMSDNFSVEDLEAFIVPKGTFVKLNPLIVHGTQYPMNQESAHVLCLLPARTFKNDCIGQPIEKEEEQAEIIL